MSDFGKIAHDIPNENFYWCFISYRHADNMEQDRKWASWLHREIEHYEVPAALVGSKNKRGDRIPERIYPVFRDEESLAADADLAGSIVDALARSRFLVTLCSPRSVESKYVAEEIQYFKQIGNDDRIIAVILDGEPGRIEEECFVAPLRHPVNRDGTLDLSIKEEPIAADFRIKEGRNTREGYTSSEAYRLQLSSADNLTKREARKLADDYDLHLQLTKLKIFAGILGVPLEELRNRDKAFQLELARKRTRRLFTISMFMTILLCIAVVMGIIANNKHKEAEKRYTEAQANHYWSNLIFSTPELSDNEVTTLLKIADDTKSVKVELVKKMMSSEELSNRFRKKPYHFTRAIVGLNNEYRKKIIISYLSSPLGSNVPDKIAVNTGILIGELDVEQLVENYVESFIRIYSRDNNASRYRKYIELGDGQVALSGKFTGQQIISVVQRLLQAMSNHLVEGFTPSALGNALVAFVDKSDAHQAELIIQKLEQAIPQLSEYSRLTAIGEALGVAAGKLSAKEAILVFQKWLHAIQQTTDASKLAQLSHVLTAAAGKLPDKLAGIVIQEWLHAIQQTTDASQLEQLGNVLAAAAGRLSRRQSVLMAIQLVQIMQQPYDDNQINALYGAVENAAYKITEKEAILLFPKLVQAIRKTSNAKVLSHLGLALEKVAKQLRGTQAILSAQKLVQVILQTTDENQLKSLFEGLWNLRNVDGKVTYQQTGLLIEKIIKAIHQSKDEHLVVEWSNRLSTVISLTAQQNGLVLKSLLHAIQHSTDQPQLVTFASKLPYVDGELEELQVAAVYKKLLQALDQTKNDDGYSLELLERTFHNLAERFSGQQADTVIKMLAQALQQTKLTTYSRKLEILSTILATIPGVFTAQQSELVVKKLVRALQQYDTDFQIRAFGEALVAIAGRISEQQTSSIIKYLLLTIEQTEDPLKFKVFIKALANINSRLTDYQADILIQELIPIIQQQAAVGSLDFDQLADDYFPAISKFTNEQIESAYQKVTQGIENTREVWQLRGLGESLAVVVGRLTTEQADLVVPTLVQSIQQTTHFEKIHAFGKGLNTAAGKISIERAESIFQILQTALQQATDEDQIRLLSNGLTAAAGRISAKQAEQVSQKIVIAMQHTTDDSKLYKFSISLAAVAKNIPDKQADLLVQKWVHVIQQTTDDTQIRRLQIGLVEVANKITSGQADSIFQILDQALQQSDNHHKNEVFNEALSIVVDKFTGRQVIQKLKQALQQTAEYNRTFGALVKGVPKITSEQADSVLPWLRPIILPLSDGRQIFNFLDLLFIVAGKITDKQRILAAQMYVDIIQMFPHQRYVNYLDRLGSGLLAVANKVTTQQADVLALNLLRAMAQQTTTYLQRKELNKALIAVAGKITDDEAGLVARKLVHTIDDPMHPLDLDLLIESLAAVSERLTAEPAHSVAIDLVQLIQKTTPDSYKLKEVLLTATGRVDADQAESLVQNLLKTLQQAMDTNQVDVLSNSLVLAASKLRFNKKSIVLLFEAFKNPILKESTHSKLLEILRGHLAHDATDKPGLWSLVEIAQNKFSGLKLENQNIVYVE